MDWTTTQEDIVNDAFPFIAEHLQRRLPKENNVVTRGEHVTESS